jgi:hypothetical protein
VPIRDYGMDDARAESGSMKSGARMLSFEQPFERSAESITDWSAVTTVGLNLAKHVFQIRGVDASGRVVVSKAMRRNKLLEL